MESRFNKYKDEGKRVSSHIANVNNFIDYLNDVGLDLVEKEINDLKKRIDEGDAPAIFSKKKKLLIELGVCIENLYETYHFNKNNNIELPS